MGEPFSQVYLPTTAALRKDVAPTFHIVIANKGKTI